MVIACKIIILSGSTDCMHIYDLKGYTLVLDKVVFVSAVFTADHEEGKQFNVRLVGDLLKFKFPTHEAAVLARQLLIKAIKEAT
jgi:hypothetical protein